jgi:hypothetical protein
LSAQVRIQSALGGGYELLIDGQKTYIKGVGGTFKLDVAAASGANACRTWGGNIQQVERTIADARANNMYIMQGIGLTKDPKMYEDEAYKDQLRKQCRELAERFKDDRSIIMWGIGNEIELNGNSTQVAWEFVNELSELIKSIDKRHLTSTVITYNQRSLNLVAKYAPSLDFVGINCYGGITTLANMVAKSDYKGAYLVTEWGPTGWWECDKTAWGAPIEQSSEEKRLCYEERYNVITSDPACLGSFVFLWGQKEERTPTWFSMFTEQNVEGLPFSGLKAATVEGMERVWTGREPSQTAPVIASMKADDMTVCDNPTFGKGKKFKVKADVKDREKDKMTFVWEVLKEATITATGGAYEPRPDRVGQVRITRKPVLDFRFDEPGAYRIYLYALDGTGYASATNLPVLIK